MTSLEMISVCILTCIILICLTGDSAKYVLRGTAVAPNPFEKSALIILALGIKFRLRAEINFGSGPKLISREPKNLVKGKNN